MGLPGAQLTSLQCGKSQEPHDPSYSSSWKIVKIIIIITIITTDSFEVELKEERKALRKAGTIRRGDSWGGVQRGSSDSASEYVVSLIGPLYPPIPLPDCLRQR